MSLTDRLTSASVVSLLVSAAGAIGAVSGLATALGLQPFWADAVASGFFCVLGIQWMYLARKERPSGIRLGFRRDQSPSRSIWRTTIPNALIAVCLVAFFVWFIYPVVVHLQAPTWKLCGTIVGRCSPSYCVRGFDERGRPVSNECVRPLDSSGYFEFTSKNQTTYHPSTLQVQCDGQGYIATLASTEFSGSTCDAIKDLK